MLKLFMIGIFSLASTVSAVGQEQKGQALQDTLRSSIRFYHPDSTLRAFESMPTLSLELPYRDSSDFLSRGREVYPRFNSWMSEPKLDRQTSHSLESLYGNFPDIVSEPNIFPFRSGSWMLESKSELLAPWRLELKSEEKYQIWRSILGSIQMGGTAYLLYLHLRKHKLR